MKNELRNVSETARCPLPRAGVAQGEERQSCSTVSRLVRNTLPEKSLSRRDILGRFGIGCGNLAALSMLLADEEILQASVRDSAMRGFPGRRPRAKSVIFLYMEGGPSQIDTFDYKPCLAREHGKELPVRAPNTVFNISKTVMQSPFSFSRYGESGSWVSEIFPHVATCVDRLTFVHSMHHGVSNHSSACYMSHTGYPMVGKPSMGAWITYGLGSESADLPSFVVLDCGQGPSGGAPSWGSGFLPATYQGTLFTRNKVPIDYLKSLEKKASRQRAKLKAIRQLNEQSRQDFGGDSRVDARIASYERAFRMQSAVPDLLDLGEETKKTKSLYGLDNESTRLFGSRCLLARRLVERGVRFVELFPPRVKADRWDQHGKLEEGHRLNAAATDQPIAALIQDLHQRGLLDETIVIWAGEFGRTPNQQGSNGRDHNPFGYTVWLAGAGFKPGIHYGQTDEFGYHAITNKVHLHDLHATILHLLGIDHTRLTYRHGGRDFRLTDVGGHVVKPIIRSS